MDSGTVHCAAILIYIRDQRPSLNQRTGGICYLNDKQRTREEAQAEETLEKRWTNQFRFQSCSAVHEGPGTISLMKKGRRAGPNGRGADAWHHFQFRLPLIIFILSGTGHTKQELHDRAYIGVPFKNCTKKYTETSSYSYGNNLL